MPFVFPIVSFSAVSELTNASPISHAGKGQEGGAKKKKKKSSEVWRKLKPIPLAPYIPVQGSPS